MSQQYAHVHTPGLVHAECMMSTCLIHACPTQGMAHNEHVFEIPEPIHDKEWVELRVSDLYNRVLPACFEAQGMTVPKPHELPTLARACLYRLAMSKDITLEAIRAPVLIN